MTGPPAVGSRRATTAPPNPAPPTTAPPGTTPPSTTTPSTTTPNTSPPVRTLRVGQIVSVPVGARSVVVGCLLTAAIMTTAVLTLTLGDLGLPVDRLRDMFGHGLSPQEEFVLGRLRGPRLAVAVTAGAGLGIAGALFQTVTRNPLGSPDVIGLAAGAGAGAAAFGLMWTGVLPLPMGALVGALVAMLLVYLGTGHGFSSPARMIIVGIGVNAMALAFIQWIITRTSREQATVIAAYLNGSTASRSWDDVRLMAVALVILLPLAAMLSRRLQVLEMGDEVAESLGARANLTRICTVIVAICCATAAVTVVGPVAFVALTAPQIGRRLTRATGPNIVVAALTGALILALADLIVQQGPLNTQLPVGILTAAVGGVYLGYLLIKEWKRVSV
ncbi:FecCD family ABC transporter permease [Phytoactinopolyspora mesophila]|uniref:Iron chelate uptake ABC transporter family permease subunit n=1 Tax=Phytoactinopolyspora mesophila TaxID=2650750 RepID=A0A7K3M5U2_9ACTN|nr:iron chelate uptake ABC transporter family permease subunit [Phytoactinopolyspora mesophila]NDL58683.1 iron chelate uptake ABC transporter family permease subunit [Phytoactinopolyspora mesophila]